MFTRYVHCRRLYTVPLLAENTPIFVVCVSSVATLCTGYHTICNQSAAPERRLILHLAIA